MNQIFNYDNGFFRAVNKMVDGLWVSILWMLFSIPIITFGASTTAFYYAVHKSLRGDRGYIWRCFWSSFKSNFKQTTKIWLMMMVIFAFLFVDSRIMYTYAQQGSKIGMMYFFFLILMVFQTVWGIYIFTYSAWFENGFKYTIKNAGIIAVLNLPWSILALALLAVGTLIVFISPITVTFIPTVVMYLYDIFLEKIYRKYMTKEDLEKEEALELGNHF